MIDTVQAAVKFERRLKGLGEEDARTRMLETDGARTNAISWIVGHVSVRRSAKYGLTLLVVIVSLISSALPAWAVPPPTPDFKLAPVDLYGKTPGYECLSADPHRAGVEGFASMVLTAYPVTLGGDAWAPCDSHSEFSLHHSGRAWDWLLAEDGEVASPQARAIANELLNWLLETVDGQTHARARRLGIVEIIWFDQLWTSHSRKWDPFPVANCADPNESNTTCHRDHVHFSFSKEGADGQTSWWNGLQGFVQSTLGTLLP